MPRIWVVGNTTAGSPANVGRITDVAELLAKRNTSVELALRDSIAGLREAVRLAAQEKAEVVLVAGGDGTLGTLAGELVGTESAMGCLPTGTANVFAQQLGLPLISPWNPKALQQAALLQLEGGARRMDVGQCNGLPFIVWAGVGLDAYITHEFERARRLTQRFGLGYFYNTLIGVFGARTWQGAAMRVLFAGQEYTNHYMMIFAANVGLYAGGLVRLTDQIGFDDGQLDFWLIEGETYADIARIALEALFLRRMPANGVRRLTGSTLEIHTQTPQMYHVDAEPQATTATQWTITLQPKALRLLVPQRSHSLFTSAI